MYLKYVNQKLLHVDRILLGMELYVFVQEMLILSKIAVRYVNKELLMMDPNALLIIKSLILSHVEQIKYKFKENVFALLVSMTFKANASNALNTLNGMENIVIVKHVILLDGVSVPHLPYI